MSLTPFRIPQFELPKLDCLFLASKKGLRTYADLENFKFFFLQLLTENDYTPGNPIGFLSSSSDELIFSIAACWQLGLPIISFDSKSTASEINKQLELMKPRIIFTDDESQQLVPSSLQIPLKKLTLDRVLNEDEGHRAGQDEFSNSPNDDPGHIFGYFFTSGTTGLPKVVPVKRRQMLFAARASEENFRPKPNHFWLLCLPLNHIGGISIIIRSILYGSAIYRMNRFDKEMVATFLSENKLFHAASLVPTMLTRLLDIQAFQTHREFQAILLGGGPADPALLKTCQEKGIPLVSSYGMTETAAQIAANPIGKPHGLYNPLRSVGRVFKPNQVQIRNDSGEVLGYNNPGSIWIRGPQVFDGYLDKETNELLFDRDGWFNTGDFGYLNARDQLYIQSRRSDLVITGGENVSPFEVESELLKMEGIKEAAVLGIPDKEWGQRVVAAIVSKNEREVSLGELSEHLKKKISPYKIPKQIVQLSELPRNRLGKIERAELVRHFEESA